MAEFSKPPAVCQPFGAFSMGVVQGEGRVVQLKGQVALDTEGKAVAPRTCGDNFARRVLDRLYQQEAV